MIFLAHDDGILAAVTIAFAGMIDAGLGKMCEGVRSDEELKTAGAFAGQEAVGACNFNKNNPGDTCCGTLAGTSRHERAAGAAARLSISRY